MYIVVLRILQGYNHTLFLQKLKLTGVNTELEWFSIECSCKTKTKVI